MAVPPSPAPGQLEAAARPPPGRRRRLALTGRRLAVAACTVTGTSHRDHWQRPGARCHDAMMTLRLPVSLENLHAATVTRPRRRDSARTRTGRPRRPHHHGDRGSPAAAWPGSTAGDAASDIQSPEAQTVAAGPGPAAAVAAPPTGSTPRRGR